MQSVVVGVSRLREPVIESWHRVGAREKDAMDNMDDLDMMDTGVAPFDKLRAGSTALAKFLRIRIPGAYAPG